MDKRYWNDLAKKYSSNVLEIADRDLNSTLNAVIKKLSLPNGVVADLGCGPGALIKHLVKKFQTVYALDFAEDLINLSEKRNKFKNVNYLQYDLTSEKPLPFKADVSFCLNALINPNFTVREAMLRSIRRATKINGRCVIVVPSYESIIHVHQTMVRLDSSLKAQLNRSFNKDVSSLIEGIVNIGGESTKCFLREELIALLKVFKFEVEAIEKIEFSWLEEIDNPPKSLKDPYPWDWLVVARKK